MNLLIEYFTPNNPIRDYEYKSSILENIKCDLIENIHVFISDDSVLDIKSDKIKIVKSDSRPTFNSLFQFCNENLKDQICIISNTDIILDDTLNILNETNLESTFLALTRWDLTFKGNSWYIQFYDHLWRSVGPGNPFDEDITTGMLSQDTWIFKSPIKTDPRLEFLMGKPGCDNRIIKVVQELGYEIKNPSKKIITKHFHQSGWRTYGSSDIIQGPYLLVKPTDKIEDPGDIKTIEHF